MRGDMEEPRLGDTNIYHNAIGLVLVSANPLLYRDLSDPHDMYATHI
jgi:hypothetical protein